jgi:hypothetical protein
LASSFDGGSFNSLSLLKLTAFVVGFSVIFSSLDQSKRPRSIGLTGSSPFIVRFCSPASRFCCYQRGGRETAWPFRACLSTRRHLVSILHSSQRT